MTERLTIRTPVGLVTIAATARAVTEVRFGTPEAVMGEQVQKGAKEVQVSAQGVEEAQVARSMQEAQEWAQVARSVQEAQEWAQSLGKPAAVQDAGVAGAARAMAAARIEGVCAAAGTAGTAGTVEAAQTAETPVKAEPIEAGEAANTPESTEVAEARRAARALLAQAAQELDEYFAGGRRTFSVPLEPAGTPFQRKVWEALRTIPYGQTRTYKQIAEQIGHRLSFRAVGMANNRNPVVILIPCHRVIGCDGTLTGYAGGLDTKERLLALENALEKRG